MNACLRFTLIVLALLVSGGSYALDVKVVGLFPNKALVQIDGGSLQTVSVGQKTREGALLVSVEGNGATFEIDGRRIAVELGSTRMGSSSGPAAAKITADERGHFMTDGTVNGIPVRFAVDTGATFISLPSGEARRIGLDYKKGVPVMMGTANGVAPAYKIQLDTVRVGEITVNSVDAVVMEKDGPAVILLGMSFLGRMNMNRDGEIMTLTKRY